MEILLSAYIDEEVTSEERQTIEDHLKDCEVCRTTATEFSRLHTLYQELEIKEAPPWFWQRVTQRLEANPRFVVSWLSWRLPRLVYVVSFALLVLLGGGIIALYIAQYPTQQSWEQASLDVDVYAEDILFDRAGWSPDEVFSVEEESIAEEILKTIDFADTDTSFFFGPDRPLRLVG